MSSHSSIDYQRIALAITWLREHYREQPELDQLAAVMDLSPGHAQRLFSQWAGISPKRFLQFLSVEYAKQRMQHSNNMLDLSMDVGLSGSGRLHDLFVTMEALSPGEYQRYAQGLSISYGISATPFGDALLAFNERGLCHLSFDPPPQPPSETLAALLPGAHFVEATQQAAQLSQQIFSQSSAERPLSTWVVGSNFQIQVWRALLRLPTGHLLSYQQLAGQLGRPSAARAVGSAVARNPIGYLIPCHRVLRQSGEIGEYHWGSNRKAAMLGWEAAQVSPEPS